MVIVQLLFGGAQQHLDHKVKDPVDQRRDCKRHHVHLRGNQRLGRREHLAHANGKCQRRILDQRDNLVAHRRQNALSDLRHHNVQNRLQARIAQHLGSLVLTARNGLQARSIDLGKVAGVVDDERHNARRPFGIGCERDAKHVVRGKVDGKHLQHERRATHDRNVDARNPAKRRDFAHAHKRHGDSQWNRPEQRQHKQLQADQESLAKHLHHDLDRQPTLSFATAEQRILFSNRRSAQDCERQARRSVLWYARRV